VPEGAPAFQAQAPDAAQAGEAAAFHAGGESMDAPVLGYRWEFGDGVSAEGANVTHAYTQARQYTVTVTATGLNAATSQKTLSISVAGTIPTVYNPAAKTRYTEAK
jgi:PKD repeat protein